MKIRVIVFLFVCGLIPTLSFAQLKKIAISDVKAGPGVIKAAISNGTSNSIERVLQAFDSQLIDRMHGTRKFAVLARSDLEQLLKEGDIAEKNFRVPGADYTLVTTLDDFQDYKESLVLQSTGEKLSKRVIRIAAVAKIYDSGAGRLIESARVNIQSKDAGGEFNSSKNGDLTDALLDQAVGEAAAKMANRVVDVIYPPKIISRIDKQVTINRGDGTDVEAGQIWQVWALGAELKDPDTGEVIDRERLAVGKVRILQVNPKTTLAEVVEDAGITNGSLVQRMK